MAAPTDSARPQRRGLKFEAALFAALTVFLVATGTVYYVWSKEWAGTVLLVLGGGLAAITGGYFAVQARLERADAAAGEQPGAPSASDPPATDPAPIHASIWPFEMGVGMAVTFTGIVLGRFVLLAGLVLLAHSLVGWIAQSRGGH